VSGIFNGNDSFTSLRNTLPQWIPLRRTSLDASIMEVGGFVIELWCLENSFPIQLFALPPAISSLLSFVPYDINALAFDCRNAELIGFEDYITSLSMMTFNLHSPQLYLPALQIARLFLLEKTQGFAPTSVCKRFVFLQHQERYVPFYARLLKHKGYEHLMDDLLSDVRAYA
jgi:hypothetical protein